MGAERKFVQNAVPRQNLESANFIVEKFVVIAQAPTERSSSSRVLAWNKWWQIVRAMKFVSACTRNLSLPKFYVPCDPE